MVCDYINTQVYLGSPLTSVVLWLCVAGAERAGRESYAPSARNTPCVNMVHATSNGSVTVKKDGEDSSVIKVRLNTTSVQKQSKS